jgi:microtubule-associated protein 1 light chain
MALNQNQAFYLLIDDKGIASMSMTLAEIYDKKKFSDGFLYMSYASQGIIVLFN